MLYIDPAKEIGRSHEECFDANLHVCLLGEDFRSLDQEHKATIIHTAHVQTHLTTSARAVKGLPLSL